MSKKIVISILVATAVTAVATSASATDANKACIDGFTTFRELFINDSAAARGFMNGLHKLVEKPDDLTLTDIVQATKEFGPERVMNELVDFTFAKRGDANNKAAKESLIVVARDSGLMRVLGGFPDVNDRFFIFRDPIAVDYDPGLDRATCKVRWTVNVGVLKQFYAVADPQQHIMSSRDIEILDQMATLQKITGDLAVRHYAVQPDGRGNTRVILLTR